MSSQRPIVSIVMPSYNNAIYLLESVASVKRQTMENWELLIVDDCSEDHSRELLQQLAAEDSRIRYFFNESNKGSGPSRNVAIQHAQGTWIAFLDADDIWIPEKLESQLAFVGDKKVAFTHSSYGYLDAEGKIMEKTFHVSNHDVTYQHLLKRTEISCLTAMYNQDHIGKFYMTDHRRKQDYALWLSILKAGHHSLPQDEVLAYYRQTPGSATRKKWTLITKHISFLQETQNLGFFPSLYYTFHWAFNGFIRYYIS